MLKGGMALELRLERARTTKDIDLRLTGSPDDLQERLQEAGRLELGDWLQFEVTPDPRHPVLEGEGLVYQGQRFRVAGQLAGKQYGDHFGLDVGMADALTAEPEVVSGSQFLEFVGLSPASLRLYPRVTHVAEKLHAYTLPRERENSRVKDLPDIALLAQTGTFASAELREALEGTFAFRDSHPLPAAVPVPPEGWEGRYARIAQQDALVWTTLAEAYAAVRGFLDPVLGDPRGEWSPDDWAWRD
jgi:Nucleotidyl transferase AbiEii toxin, Type IV TA system